MGNRKIIDIIFIKIGMNCPPINDEFLNPPNAICCQYQQKMLENYLKNLIITNNY